jgi:uncharacterized protein YciW
VTSLQVWLANRHTDVTVSVSVPGGRQITLTATRVAELTQVQELLITALAELAPHPAHSDAAGVAVERPEPSPDGTPPVEV